MTAPSCGPLLEERWRYAGAVDVRLLGTTELERDDGSLAELGAAKVRQLLALLAHDPGRPHSVEVIVDALWPDDPPATAINLVQGYVSDLRRIVGTEQVVRTGNGYRFELAALQIDLVRFQRLVDHARTLLGDDIANASRLLTNALSLWRGPAFSDIACNGVLAGAKLRADELFLEATELRVEAELAGGHHRELVPVLEELTVSHPLREAFWVQLALALYRSGRQADALRRCHALRALLREEIGVRPGPDLLAMEDRIARHDPALTLNIAPNSASAPQEAAPLRGSEARSRTLVGRESELDRMTDRFNRTISGSQHLVMVGGEPGIGKTTLAMEMCRRAAERGAVVLRGRCDEHLVAPYLPFISALTDTLRSLDPDQLITTIEPRRRSVLEIIPGLVADTIEPRIAPMDVQSVESDLSIVERFATLEWLLNRVRGEAPLVLLLDDLQWADSTSIGLLGYLTLGSRLPKTLILGTYRSTELDLESRLAELLVRLRSHPNSERVTVKGLSRADIERLVGGSAVDDGYTTWIESETGGNPLFIGELIRQGEIHGRNAGPPEGVLDVLGQRIRRLTPSTQTFLERAAVIGDDLPVALLRATNADLDDLSGAISEAVRSAILEEHPQAGYPTYRFTHATIRKAVTNMTTIVRREDLHLRAARAQTSLDSSGAATIRIAAHYRDAGSAAPTDEAVQAFARAGGYAKASGANVEAVQWFDRALGLLGPDDPLRRQLRLTRFVAAQSAWHGHFDENSIRRRTKPSGVPSDRERL